MTAFNNDDGTAFSQESPRDNPVFWQEAAKFFCQRLNKPQQKARLEDSPQRVEAARAEARPYLNTLADWQAAGFIDPDWTTREVRALFAALAQQFGLAPAEATVAHDTAWDDATRAATARIAAIHKAIKPLAWNRAPMTDILLAARAAVDRTHANLGNHQITDLVIAVCRPIEATLRRRERRR